MTKQNVNNDNVKNVEMIEPKVDKNSTQNQTLFDSKFMRVFKWFIPALIVFVVLMINYALKGIAPFGNRYVSYIDMEVGYVPVYYSLWDAVHTGGNFFYNFFLGGGSNVYGSLVSNAFWSPLTWLILIVPRNAISAFLSWYLIIKLALMATTMYYFIRKVFTNVNPYLQILYSILWTFSGWMIGHYTNIIWLDNMILFPFLILGIKRIFDQNKMDLFILILTLCLMFSFYMSFMVLLMMIFCGGAWIFFSTKTKDEKKKIVSKLVVGTLLSLFISFISFLPAFWQSWTSHRITNAVKKVLYENTWSKGMLILINCFTMFGFVKLITKYKQDKKVVLSFIVMFALTTVTILLERVNMMWHTGSYQSFPYRFAFVPIFVMICGGLYYFNNHFKYEESKKKKFDYSLIALFFAIVVYLVVVAANMSIPAFTVDWDVFATYALGCAVGVFTLFRVFAHNNKLMNMIVVPIVVFAEILANCFCLVGLNVDNGMHTTTDNFDMIYEELKLPDDNYRYQLQISNVDNAFMNNSYNYPYIIRKQSLSTWLHIIGSNQVLNAEQLGYATSKTILSDMGSTYFANMTANVKYVISDHELNSRVYTLVDSNEKFYVYQYNFTLPYAGIYKTEDMIESIPEEYQGFEASNYLYNNVYNMSGEVISEISFVAEEIEGEKIKYTIDVPADSLLYYSSKVGALSNKGEYSYTVNGEKRLFYSDIMEVGYYNNETVEVVIDKDTIEKRENLIFGVIDVSKLENLSNTHTVKEVNTLKLDGNKITATVTGEAGESFYIPFNFDGGWKATINGKEVKVNRTLNTYMSVKLQEGKNEIEFTFTPPMYNIGLIVSLVALALTIGLWAINRFTKFKFIESKIFNNIFFWVGIVGFCVAGLLIYIKPIFETIIYLG